MRVIGIESGANWIRAAGIEVNWKGSASLDSCREVSADDPEGSASLLREINRADQVIAVYPGTLVSSRHLSLPFTQTRKIDQVLPFEIESLLPFEIDQVVLSYQLISQQNGTSDLLVAVTPKEEIARFLEYLGQRGIDPHFLEWDGMALFNFSKILADPGEPVTLFLRIGPEQSVLLMTRDGSPCMIRSIGAGLSDIGEKERRNGDHLLIRELKKSIQAFKSDDAAPVRGLRVSVAGAADAGIAGWISGELDLPLSNWTVNPARLKIPDADRPGEGSVDPRFIPAIGAALKGTPLKDGLSQINFRRGEYSHRRVEKGKRGIQRTILLFSALVLLLGWADLGVRFTIKKSHFEKLDRELKKEYREAFTPSGPVVNEIDQARGSLSALRKKEAFFNMNGPSPLEILREITVQIPKEIRFEVNELTVDGEKIRIEAETDSFDSLDKIKDALGKDGVFGERIVTDSKMNAEESKVRFKLEMLRGAKERQKR
jgi:general secretion pathway protein L